MKRLLIIFAAFSAFFAAGQSQGKTWVEYNRVFSTPDITEIDSVYCSEPQYLKGGKFLINLTPLVFVGKLSGIGMLQDEKLNVYYDGDQLVAEGGQTYDYDEFPIEIPDELFSYRYRIRYRGDHGLKYITLSNNVVRIGKYAFCLEEALLNVGWCYYDGRLKEIDDYAFAGCSNLKFHNKRLELPEPLSRIGRSAFAGVKLDTLVIPATVVKIGDYAFTNTNNNDRSGKPKCVICLAKNPPSLGENPFDLITFDENGNEIKPILIVPKGRKRFYYSENCPWRKIFAPNIYEIGEEPSGIDEVPAESVAPESGVVYDIQGRQVGEMESGQVYIRDGKKVIVR